MERCEGTLGQYLVDLQRLSLQLTPIELIEITLQILNGLHHCHERNVCHRDLKLSNSNFHTVPLLT